MTPKFFVIALVWGLARSANAQKPSPCPQVFSYEPRGTENDRWYGTIALQTNEDLSGIWVHVTLDRPAELLGNWFGEATSTDNVEYTIKNSKYKLEAGPPVSVRFFVKYNAASTIPSVKSIRLNGKNICKQSESSSGSTGQTLHISEIKPVTGRPSNGNNNNNNDRPRPSTGTGSSGISSRPSNSNEDFGNSQSGRPSSSSSSSNTQTQRPVRPNTNFGNNDDFGSNSQQPSRPSRPSSSDNFGSSNTQRPRPSSSVDSDDDWSNRPQPSRPSNQEQGLSVGDDSEFFPGDFAQERPSLNRPSVSRPTVTQTSNVKCGTVAMRPSPLISHGQNTTQGQFPWHAALYHSQGIQLRYTCGGTLVSENHVITAAHCVTKPQTNRAINPQDLLVYLGKYDLRKFGPEVQDRGVSDIHVHPQYNHSVYFNDIAILRLERSADITSFVRPCCLWDESPELDDILNRLGTVVGWGFDENRQLTNSLMQAQMPIVSTVKCIYSNREFFSQFTFEKNFCAGFKNGTSVCNGDSGGGMVLPKTGTSGASTVWQLRGLVSVGVALQGQGVCDPSHYIVFTDVAKHRNWIAQTMDD